jgi:hypothetical protein
LAQPGFGIYLRLTGCGQVSEKFVAGTLQAQYLIPMSQVETDYPGVAFIYMTGHVDHWADTNDKAANTVIRDYCRTNGKILYDFADIESYDPDGTFYEFPNDTCDYYESAESNIILGNWATAWRSSLTQNVDWYSCGAAHTQPLNANQKAYAVWWLWAHLARLARTRQFGERAGAAFTPQLTAAPQGCRAWGPWSSSRWQRSHCPLGPFPAGIEDSGAPMLDVVVSWSRGL